MANTGPVVSPAGARRIFHPFQRLNNRTSHDGSGLGLAIVASIAAIHGGTATASPRDDGGLSVTVTIPSAGRPAGEYSHPTSVRDAGLFSYFPERTDGDSATVTGAWHRWRGAEAGHARLGPVTA